MSDSELSMPWEDEPSTDSVTLDSPVAALNEFGDDDGATYGSNKERLQRQQSNQNEQTSDDIDVRQLFNKPTVDLIRWQYRQNGMASTVVDKPVKDAFKHGFTFNTIEDGDISDTKEFIKNTYVPKLREARIKSRRDGVTLLFWVVNDTNKVSEPVENSNGIVDLRVLTIDELGKGYGNPRYSDRKLSDAATADLAAEHVEYDEEQLVVTRSGLVVVDDITSNDHEDFVGCMYQRNPQLAKDAEYQFIHADRLKPIVSRPFVDGDVDDLVYGFIEGDSVLAPIIHALTGITKAEWALGQSLLRYTAPLHAVEIDGNATPNGGDWEEHLEKLNKQLDNINNKSSLALPPAHSAKTLTSEGDIDPEPFLDGLINDICAGAEITRSVLLGTQAGTVSGSSTDIKNYYNQVERDRDGTYSQDLQYGASEYARFTNTSIPSFDIEWGPLFRIEDIKRAEGMNKIISAVTQATNNYVLSHEEAREIVQAEWSEFEIEADIDGTLSEEDMDQLDRINTSKGKQFGEGRSAEDEVDGGQSKRSGQNGGGREGGNTTDPDDPT